MRRLPWTTAVLLTLACLITAVACGGTDGGTTTDTEATPATEEPTPATTAPRDEGDEGGAAGEEAVSAFCEAWEETAPALMMVGLVGAFAELEEMPGGTVTGGTMTAEGTNDVLILVISPKLEVLFETAAEASEGEDAEAFAAVAEVLAGGTDRLREAGLSDRQIAELREADLTAEEEPPVGDVDEAALEQAAEGFAAEVDEALTDLEGSAAGSAFEALVDRCEEPSGEEAAAGDVEVCDLLSEATVTSLVGADPVVEGPLEGFAGGASCLWGDEPDEKRLAVTVAGAGYYEQIRDGYGESLIEPVGDLGDEAFTAEGFNYAAGGGTQGRSLFVLVGDRTLVIAFAPRDGEATTAQLEELGTEALASLG